ncbi:MAG: TonB-dependent receptor [Ferruginibacter sp.]|nr:TonB-dependent receptor [Ferruginibacter sp.]
MKKNGCVVPYGTAASIIKCLLIMKMTILLICIFSLQSFAGNSYGQEKITLHLENATLKKVFKAIERQTTFRFVYNDDILSPGQKVSISVLEVPLDDVMKKLLDKTTLDFKIVGSNLVVIAVGLHAAREKNIAPAFAIRGKINNEEGKPMANVSIVEKGTTNGTTTKEDGSFTLDVANGNIILLVSYVGFKSQEINVKGRNSIDITLQEEKNAMDEVVVVGYGTQRRKDVTGSVSSVPKSRLSQLPVTNLFHAIEGSVAGVGVVQNSAVPGRTATVQVRGLNSITANSSPLLVVDGIPLSQDASINDINSNDVASMEILKDASAVAIYGVRGSNGVILITTKRGGSAKSVIRYSAYAGSEDLAHILEPASPQAYLQKWVDYKKQQNLSDTSILPNLFERNNYYAGNKPVDWINEVMQSGVIQDHNLSISGGSKDAKFYISGEYMKEKGPIKGYQYNRASLRSNLDINVTDYLSVGTSLFYTANNYDGGRSNFYLAAAMSPYAQLYNANGGYEIFPMSPEILYTNPLLGLNTDRVSRSNNLNGNAYLELKPVKGLKYRLNAGYSYIPSRSGNYSGRNANSPLGTASVSSSESKYWIVENILSYTKDWKKHHFDFTGLYSAQQKEYIANATNATGFINDQLSFNNLGAGATVSAGGIFDNFTGSYRDVKKNASQMGRINYSYNSRYLLTLTARRDGSSVFGANTTKYGVFPSIGLGWNISSENFMRDLLFVNSLKLRGSYGKTGNEAIGINKTTTTDATVRFPFNGISTIGVLASNLGNANLHWEETKGSNIGMDFSLFTNRVSGSIDAYKTKTDGILLNRNIPIITGYSSIIDNLGKIQNKGIELTLNTVNVKTGSFTWETSINYTSYRNKIISLYGNRDSTGREISDLGNRWFIGQPVRVIFDYQMQGVWQEGEDASRSDPAAKPGSLKFADIDGNGKIDANDRIVLGSPLPKWTGGFTNTFHYKNILHLNVFIQTVRGALRNNVNQVYADEAGRMNVPGEIGYWTPENKSNTRPGLSGTSVNNVRGYGYPQDAGYTRIKDITLSYTMPQSLLDKVKLAGLTLYVSGRNLYTFTNWVGWDPEFDYSFRGSGDWTNNYPQVRSVVAGLNLTLR